MSPYLLVAAGGAAGAAARYGCSQAVHALLGRSFPYGTLFVNVVGSLLMGIAYVCLLERLQAAAAWRALLLTGVLGGFTTFSTFSVETLVLLEEGAFARAGWNVALSVGTCLLACAAGMWLARSAWVPG